VATAKEATEEMAFVTEPWIWIQATTEIRIVTAQETAETAAVIKEMAEAAEVRREAAEVRTESTKAALIKIEKAEIDG
jgi:hypothetical protein